jgi:hypothetical protein
MEEWNYSGASAVPAELANKQQKKWFHDITFHRIREFLEAVKTTGKA